MEKKKLNLIIEDLIQAKPTDQNQLVKAVRRISSRLQTAPPKKADLLSAYHKLVKSKKIMAQPELAQLLTKRAVRTMSGVAVISVLTKPADCPGQCLFCPTQPAMPKSYLANEPAVMRAILNQFHPFKQIKMRLKALQDNGHATDKIELIVMGGTWSCHSLQYQSWFIKQCFEALNGKKATNLAQAHQHNQTAKHRCVGLTLETRPDYINEAEIKRLRQLGCTRVELGIQHIREDILKHNCRGHDVKTSIRAIALLKQAGFKINYHLMLNLPGSTPTLDFQMFKTIYTHPDWMPDMVKIYPCVVTQDSQLYEIYRQGGYTPYTDKQLLALLVKIKKITPSYVRITRLIRDIPAESIQAGNKITNLRQLIGDLSQQQGWSCQCIRCREAGHQTDLSPLNDEIQILEYTASQGREFFLSFESLDKKVLYAFLRLRINRQSANFIPELKQAALVREVHTYGQLTALKQTGQVQHTGLGKRLLNKAEEICITQNIAKLAVISGIGVRQYYAKLGYELKGTYMVKNLN